MRYYVDETARYRLVPSIYSHEHFYLIMKRLAWLTDLHLEFIGMDNAIDFFDRVVGANPEIILLAACRRA